VYREVIPYGGVMNSIPLYRLKVLDDQSLSLVDEGKGVAVHLDGRVDAEMGRKAALWLNLISTKTANQALHKFAREGGYPPGSGLDRIFDACIFLDEANLARLELGFPEIVAANKLWKHVPGGTALLAGRAEGGS